MAQQILATKKEKAGQPAPGIKGVLETSFIDWPGRTCAMLFLGGCNFRCPFCHNHPLVLQATELKTLDEDITLIKLTSLKNWLGGICISGGEPTLDPELPNLLRRLKKDGWPAKLDTNGSRPEILEQLLAEDLLDMVSMDVKAPLIQEKYNQCAGTSVDLEKIKKSIMLLKQSAVDHEFRMTVLPRFHSAADVADWATRLEGSKLKLQNFSPRSTMDPAFARDKSFPTNIFEELQKLTH